MYITIAVVYVLSTLDVRHGSNITGIKACDLRMVLGCLLLCGL